MGKFTDIIREYEDYSAVGGVSKEQIKAAEEELGVCFSKEYKDFLSEHGTACANGHEFLGICNSKRLSIVACTQKEKSKNEKIPQNLYLIENVGIDKLLTWQDENGVLYQTVANSAPEKMQMNITDYVQQ